MKAEEAAALYPDPPLQLGEAHRAFFKGLKDGKPGVMPNGFEQFRPGNVEFPFACARGSLLGDGILLVG